MTNEKKIVNYLASVEEPKSQLEISEATGIPIHGSEPVKFSAGVPRLPPPSEDVFNILQRLHAGQRLIATPYHSDDGRTLTVKFKLIGE